MNKTELNAKPSGHVIARNIVKKFNRESHFKHVVIDPLFKTHCDDCSHPFPPGEKVVRYVASNRVLKTKCLDCYIERQTI